MDYCEYPSPVGTLYLTADEGGLTGIWMHPEKTEDFPVLAQAKGWIPTFPGIPQKSPSHSIPTAPPSKSRYGSFFW